MIPNCFMIYFNPIYLYIKKVYELASSDDFELTIRVSAIATIHQFCIDLFKINFFGAPNFLLFLVILTVLIDARFGIKKSVKESKEMFEKSLSYNEDDPEKKAFLKMAKLKEFDPKKLQFTFFKCFTLLGYLFFVKNILEINDSGSSLSEILGFASGVVTKAPLAIFWYYDFKSIGDNAAYLYGKKAPIFIIVEQIFEPKINNFFNSKKD